MRYFSCLFFFLFAACTPAPISAAEDVTATAPVVQFTQTYTSQPPPTLPAVETMPEPTADVASATPEPVFAVCSPLQDIPFEAIAGMISNPYHPPKPGYDDPHAGIDIAVNLAGSEVAVAGHPVQAALPGRVAMISTDRFPFGSAVIIETPLDALPIDWQTGVEIPTLAPTLEPRSALTCPPTPVLENIDYNRRSLYTLYAHLQDPPGWALDDEISCGQVIGHVGGTGNALNPHLHFETRSGPAGIRLAPMAHYDASATAEEMSAYCQWSVSGLFQLVDPQKVLGILP